MYGGFQTASSCGVFSVGRLDLCFLLRTCKQSVQYPSNYISQVPLRISDTERCIVRHSFERILRPAWNGYRSYDPLPTTDAVQRGTAKSNAPKASSQRQQRVERKLAHRDVLRQLNDNGTGTFDARTLPGGGMGCLPAPTSHQRRAADDAAGIGIRITITICICAGRGVPRKKKSRFPYVILYGAITKSPARACEKCLRTEPNPVPDIFPQPHSMYGDYAKTPMPLLLQYRKKKGVVCCASSPGQEDENAKKCIRRQPQHLLRPCNIQPNHVAPRRSVEQWQCSRLRDRSKEKQ